MVEQTDQVVLEVPALLSDSVGGAASVSLRARSIRDAAAEVKQRWPVLATLVFSQAGEVRPHVLLLRNGKVLRGDADLQAGDRLTILQAVSGG